MSVQNKITPCENFPGLLPGFFGFNEMPKERDCATERKREALERYRLVKGSKSPTSQNAEFMHGYHRAKCSGKELEPFKGFPEKKILEKQAGEFSENVTGPGKFVVVGHREWSDEYRIRTEVQRVNKEAPPEQSGERVSEILSTNGARKIAESCEYMAAKKGGYSTFLTLTFDDKARKNMEVKKLVKAGDPLTHLEDQALFTPLKETRKTTIQKEVSRFFDAAQKIYQRGWEYENDKGEFVRVEGHSDKLHYCWVCEVPDRIDNESGEITGKNPHVHVLMRWRVEFKHFQAWAKRIEKIWGQGMAHLEKIKEGEKAGAYMAKAAGYLCKAQGKDPKNDQGVVYGNRYNISRDARAPDWVCVGRYELGRMGWLLSEASDAFNERFGYVNENRKRLVKKLKKTDNKVDRQKIGKLLEKTRNKIKRMPRLSKYQAILKGEKQYQDFMNWAESDVSGIVCEWLPEKGPGESFQIKPGQGVWYAEFFKRRCERKENRKWSTYLHETETNHYWIDLICHFNQHAPPDDTEGDTMYFYDQAINEGLLQ